MSAEFDEYATEYRKLLHDPLRTSFSAGGGFFFLRKWILISEYLRLSGAGNSSWLDVGCGNGDLLRLGRRGFARAPGCDVSSAMTRTCQDLEVVVQPEPTRLPFPDCSFDLITAVCVFHHVAIQDRPALVSEMARVLVPGGSACIIEHNPFNPVTQLIVRRTPVDANARLLAAGKVLDLMERAGLTPLAPQYFLYFPERLFFAFSRMERILARIPAGGQYAVFGRRPTAG
jgi:SAM-dependent methyltransferase